MRIRAMGFVVAAMIAALFALDVMAQQAPRERRERRERPAIGERGDIDMEAARERWQETRMNRIKDSIEATDDEWVVLRPRIEKIQQLDQAAGIGSMMGRMPRPGADREPNEIETATRELRDILRDEAANAEHVNEKLTALRLAREKHQQELEAAREELRELVTVRQEAQLVLQGILE